MDWTEYNSSSRKSGQGLVWLTASELMIPRLYTAFTLLYAVTSSTFNTWENTLCMVYLKLLKSDNIQRSSYILL